jgi:hypothetical protein
VFEETTRIINELFEFWSKQFGTGPVQLDDAVDMTAKLALMVISSAGLSFSSILARYHTYSLIAFGKRPRWDEDDTPPKGHKMVSITFTLYINCLTRRYIDI